MSIYFFKKENNNRNQNSISLVIVKLKPLNKQNKASIDGLTYVPLGRLRDKTNNKNEQKQQALITTTTQCVSTCSKIT